MDITSFVASKRERALLVGDYGTYSKSLSNQLHSIRKRLGRTTPKNAKSVEKAPVTAEDVGSNPEFVHLLLVQAERSWALAMHIKSTHAADNSSKGISGSTRKHIIAKLHKAACHARLLVTLLTDRTTTNATDNDYLEAEAYASYLSGSESFEQQVTKSFDDSNAQKQAWTSCLAQLSEAHVTYSALLLTTQKDVFRDFIGGNVDPSIRYAAYQSKLPRTIAIPTVAKRNFRREQQKDLLTIIEKLSPNALAEDSAQKARSVDGESSVAVPTTITWRKRTAPISDAAIGQALATTALTASKLSSQFASTDAETKPQTLAAAYDPVLNSAQDAVDAVHRSISDLTKEGVAESDSRMQDLRVSDLAVNYSLISWRIGRNRVLVGGSSRDDGATFLPDVSLPRQSKTTAEATMDGDAMDVDKSETEAKPKRETLPHALARLTTRIVLLDSTIQSIDSLTQLPGAARDTAFQSELSTQRAYFQALKCINIAHSHIVVARTASMADKLVAHKQALALIARASETLNNANGQSVSIRCTDTPGLLPDATAGNEGPPTLIISSSSLSHLKQHIKLSLVRQHGLCTLHQQQADAIDSAKKTAATDRPLIERLDTYPPGGYVDVKKIVAYPPRMEPVPVKPIFLDLAWNYIDYPGKAQLNGQGQRGIVVKAASKVADTVAGGIGASPEEQPKKKGWFGFGR